eukprot:XP_011678956.1 PREDICTED: uncharacterized protein LOC100893892 [Strongylocentrotus purpuratus]
MPEGPELDVGQGGDDNQTETIGMEEMLYASQSTLENAVDGNISREEYHLKLVTESGFLYQVGCLTDTIANSDDTEILVQELRETFEGVETGNISEDDYFFELMSPYFYYTSGNYHLSDQVQTTKRALASTSSFESEEYSTQIINVYALLASNESYNPKILPFLDFDQAPTYPKKGIRENDINFPYKAQRPTKEVKMKSLRAFGLMQRRSVGGNWSYILLIQLSIVLCAQSLLVRALPVNTEPESPLTLTVGSDGVIPFACRNAQQSGTKYYTVKFEEKDRPFYIDGDFDLEGLMSPDQAERFRVAYSEEGSSMSFEINIASVSMEDQGTYIVLLIIQGVTPEPEYHLMKRVVLILIPPGPAICFLMPSEQYKKVYEVHCHAKPGNGNSTLACFQNGRKMPYRKDGDVDNTQIVSERIFWLMNQNIPVSCCSHDAKEIKTITQTSCDQFRYPRIEQVNSPVPPFHEKNQPSPESTSYSGCDPSFDWPSVMLPLMAFFTYMCISNA